MKRIIAILLFVLALSAAIWWATSVPPGKPANRSPSQEEPAMARSLLVPEGALRPMFWDEGDAVREFRREDAELWEEAVGRVLPYLARVEVWHLPQVPADILPDPGVPGEETREEIFRQEGGGILWEGGGAVLVPYDLVAGATQVRVQLHDRRILPAVLSAVDESTRLAILRVGEAPSGMYEWGSALAAEFGETVMLLRLDRSGGARIRRTVVSGIGYSSAKVDPNLVISELQLSDVLTPDLDGAVVISQAGRILGMAQCALGRGGCVLMAEQVGFVAEGLARHGYVPRADFGAAVQMLHPGMERFFGLESPQGVLVRSVVAEGPAAKAGLEAGDVVLEINGRRVDTAGLFQAAVSEVPPGTEVRLQVVRNGDKRQLDVVLGAVQAPVAAPVVTEGRAPPEVVPLETGGGLPGGWERLLVALAREGGVWLEGWEATGLLVFGEPRKGDRIVTANRRAVVDAAGWGVLLGEEAEAEELLLELEQGDSRRFVLFRRLEAPAGQSKSR